MIKSTLVFDPVFDTQKTFVQLMNAMAFPGRLMKIEKREFHIDIADPYRYPAAVFLTLCDNGSAAGFSDDIDDSAADSLLKLCGAGHAAPKAADFFLFSGKVFSDRLWEINRGTLDFPEHSTTAIIMVEFLENGQSASAESAYTVTGPGVKYKRSFSAAGLDPGYIGAREILNDVYPTGIDYFLCDPEGHICGLPRTVACESAGGEN